MEKMAISQTVRNASPFLKWAGGKTQLLPMLLNYIPAHFDTYIEPFAGGGGLFSRCSLQRLYLLTPTQNSSTVI
jgi:site-specific DNA-adenine methylase